MLTWSFFLRSTTYAVLLFAFSRSASAAPSEAQAIALADAAMQVDFEQHDYGFAVDKLTRAQKMCATRCSTLTRARILRDLGIVYLEGRQDREAALVAFVDALRTQPTLKLEAGASSGARSLFSEARTKASKNPGPAAASAPKAANEEIDLDADDEEEEEEEEEEEAPPPKKRAAKEESKDTAATKHSATATKHSAAVANADDEEEEEEEEEAPPAPKLPPSMVHDPVAELGLDHPLPLFVQLYHVQPGQVASVHAYVRAFGDKQFTEVPMQVHGEGYGVEVPCNRIGTTTGKLAYYFTALDAAKQPLASAGSATEPYSTAIRAKTKGEVPHLPGKPAPALCKRLDDCPPDFPGCAVPGQFPGENPDAKAKGESPPWLWLSAAVQLDFPWLPATNEACAKDSAYDCYYGGDAYRDPSNPEAGVFEPNGDRKGVGNVAGGFTFGTLRLLLGGDYAFSPNLRAGVRLGFAFLGSPKVDEATSPGNNLPSFVPFHAEIRGRYLFNYSIPVVGLKPFVSLGLGLGQVDAQVRVPVIDLAYKMSCEKEGKPVQCLEQRLDAWRKMGRLFAGLGGGVEYALDERSALALELRLLQLFPSYGTAVSVQAGYQRAF